MAVELKLFTMVEASQLIAEIRPALERLVELRREHDRTGRRAAVLELAVAHWHTLEGGFSVRQALRPGGPPPGAS